jgi:polyhydroxyalkanoate synthesis regulator phasin
MTMATTRRSTKKNDLQSEIKDTVNRMWIAGRGVVAQAGVKGKEMLDELDLADTARKTAGEASRFAGQTFRKLETLVDDKVAAALDRYGVPSRDQIRDLSRRVADLTAKVEKLTPKSPKSPKSRRA